MPSLRDLQVDIREAVLSGNAAPVAPALLGGGDGGRRLAVHSRHYQTSLVSVLVDRYPATVWLVGPLLVTEAAREFARVHPPSRPCLAEHGREFPAFLSGRDGAVTVPYLQDFAELEWHVGEVAVEIDHGAVGIDGLAGMDPDILAGSCVTLQPGVRYLCVSWNVDELLTLYLADSEPERFDITRGDGRIEIRGARGDVHMTRLTVGEFTFRTALAEGCPLAEAAERALGMEEGFDPGSALLALVGTGLVARVDPTRGRKCQ